MAKHRNKPVIGYAVVDVSKAGVGMCFTSDWAGLRVWSIYKSLRDARSWTHPDNNWSRRCQKGIVKVKITPIRGGR